MKTTAISEAKDRLSALLDQVGAGETFLILDRGVPVARLEPVTAHPAASGRARRLERAGLVSVPSAPPPLELLAGPGPRVEGDVSVVRVLLDERAGGR
jgi:antitoxin (DNA-binding transcriptional repressor) of toxin-antitoxin stability system